MYAHQVVESLKKTMLSFKEEAAGHRLVYDVYCAGIQRAIKFHVPSAKDLFGAFEKNYKGMKIFTKDQELLRLPFKVCWVDMFVDFETPILDTQSLIKKRGCLIIEYPKEDLHKLVHFHLSSIQKEMVMKADRVYTIIVFNSSQHMKEDFFRSLGWIPNPLGYLVFFGQGFETGNIMPTNPFNINLSQEQTSTLFKEDSTDLSCIDYFLRVLHCKNIVKVPHHPPPKLQKKRAKSGKVGLFKYHTLMIRPTNRKVSLGSGGESTRNTRIHFCRGHFKEYTAEAPLFGRFTGLYWWQPHVRGDKKQGVVMKDYQLDTKTS